MASRYPRPERKLELAEAPTVTPVAKHFADRWSACIDGHRPMVVVAAITSQVMDEASPERHAGSDAGGDMGLEGLRALIIGGTSGIGARTAERLAKGRSRVVIAGRREEEGERLASRLGHGAQFVRCDVTVESDVARAVSHAVDRFGGLDALVNSAGGGVPEPRGIAAADLATTRRRSACISWASLPP
jgi:hypothetical protein